MESFPRKSTIWQTNPNLKNLLLVFIVLLLLSGICLSVMSYMQTQYRQQIYEQNVAEMPKHQLRPATTITDQATASTTQLFTKVEWKTYTNDQYGIEFQYPADFFIITDGPPSPEVKDLAYNVALTSNNDLANWEIRYFASHNAQYYDPRLIEKETTIYIDGVKCQNIYTKAITQSKTEAVICEHNSHDYDIDFDLNNPAAKNPQLLDKEYQTMLASFKFTK